MARLVADSKVGAMTRLEADSKVGATTRLEADAKVGAVANTNAIASVAKKTMLFLPPLQGMVEKIGVALFTTVAVA